MPPGWAGLPGRWIGRAAAGPGRRSVCPDRTIRLVVVVPSRRTSGLVLPLSTLADWQLAVLRLEGQAQLQGWLLDIYWLGCWILLLLFRPRHQHHQRQLPI